MQLGVFGGMVTLYPFPAAYSQGLLKNVFDTFILFIGWCFTFGSFAYVSFILQLTRLQAVARPGKWFDMITLIYASMYLETRQNASNVQSFRSIKERLKGLQNFVTQSIIMCSFTTISIVLILQTIFNDPSEDSRIQNLFAYSFLCGTTIPAQISMIWRNPAYRNFVMARKKSIVVIPDVSGNLHRRSIIPNS
ncbi:hypothetical protein B9Z55_018368 [Caenorhabditis nigoni]|nr:hypothetical protein B9Z55_018368 [Caenorhabditis nigoni]